MRGHLTLICLCATTVGAAVWAGAQERTTAGDSSSSASPSSSSTSFRSSTSASASAPASSPSSSPSAVPASRPPSHGASVARGGAGARAEGEKRFRANCERCHAAPEKFPPRMMATIVRHMRVRAYISEEDARLILNYMSQ